MLKILRTVCAVVVMAATFPINAQAQTHAGVVGGTRIDAAPVGGAGFGAGPRYYGGVYHGTALDWRGGAYRAGVWSDRYRYYGNWRQSYSPYWGWAVGAGLLATAPTYYYYGVGFGDELGYEATLPDDAIAYCMQRFRSYDPVTGTYLGRGGYRYPCP